MPFLHSLLRPSSEVRASAAAPSLGSGFRPRLAYARAHCRAWPCRYGNELGVIYRAAVEQDLGRGFRYTEPSSPDRPAAHELPTILVGPGLWARINPSRSKRDNTAAAGKPLVHGLHSVLPPDVKMSATKRRGKHNRFPQLPTDLSVYREHYRAGAVARHAQQASHAGQARR